MGEVYKARDTRLDRTVAIKILPDTLAADPQFRERFDREGRAISQLTHPHICTLYDVGQHDGTAFLVMEYLEGGTLADRLAKGALPVDQALKIAIEVAAALDKAHRAGIVHRDLKPGNIMLTRSGAKLLDFGLAKSRASVIGGAGESMLPTTYLTEKGVVLGTFQYMAPEQIEGQEADARTDIFAFGVVLYEMLAGRRAFEGKTHASLLGAILKDHLPPISSVQPLAPASLDHLVGRCLEKDPEARWHSAHDLHDELAWITSERPPSGAAAAARARPARERAGWIAAVTVAVLSAALWVFWSGWRRVPAASDAPEMRLQILMPVEASLSGFALSPDRRALVYQATTDGRTQLWLRTLDSETARPLEGTDRASGNAGPFWSPDSRSIGFFSAQQLKRLDLDSGLVRTLAGAPQPRGGTWGATGTILFASGSSGSVNAVPAGGGEVQGVTRLERPRQTSHRFPHFLPDGRHFLFYSIGTSDVSGVYLGALGSTATTRLFGADSAAVFLAPDRLLFARQGALWAQRLDLREVRLLGEPAPVSAKLAVSDDVFGDVALSETAPGLIAYRAAASMRQFIWLDRTGRQVGTIGASDDGQASGLRLSRDGRTVTFRRTLNGNSDLWSIDVGRQVMRRLTFDITREYEAVSSPAGDRIVFNSDRSGLLDLYEMPLSGSAAAPTLLLATSEHKNTNDWSDDGRFLLYSVQSGTTANDVWALPLSGDRKPLPVANTPATEGRARFSPDGRWVAYESNESGRAEIYVQSFPDPSRRTQMTTDGGTTPIWRRDGAELYFRSPDDHLMAARIAFKGADIDIGTPSVLFRLPPGPGREATTSWYAVAADGQRFLVNTFVEGGAPITILLNWKPGT